MRVAILGADGVVEHVLECGPDWSEIFADGVESDVANVGDLYDPETGTFTPPAAPAPTTQELLRYIAEMGWRVETGGIEVVGIPIATDDRSKILIMGAREAAQRDAAYQTTWTAANGERHLLAASDIIAVADALLAHVSACFATRAGLADGVAAGAITSFAQIDAADWPGGI